MSQNSKLFSDEFKKQIIKLYNSGGSVSYFSRVYGVTSVTIYKWIKESSPIQISDE